jgi:hypothetical protein
MLLRSMSAKSIGNRFPLPGCRGISGRGSCRPAELTSPAILHSRSDAQFRGEIRLGLLCAGSSSAKIGRSVGSREKTHMARVGTASPLRRDRGFESPFLQRGVWCEPDFLDRGWRHRPIFGAARRIPRQADGGEDLRARDQRVRQGSMRWPTTWATLCGRWRCRKRRSRRR